VYNRFNEQVFWDGKRREAKAVIRHQMQCLAQYFLGKRSGYEPFRFDAVKKSLAQEGQLSFNPPVCMLITWDSRNRRRLEKAVGLCKDYGLTALSRRVYLGNVKKNDLPELQQNLRRLFIGKKDRLFLFMLCKSCMGISTVPLAIQERIVQPPKFELVG